MIYSVSRTNSTGNCIIISFVLSEHKLRTYYATKRYLNDQRNYFGSF